jgi:enoyl-CoA hydratase
MVVAGLDVRIDGPVGWIVFARPERGNAMDSAMMSALPQAWRRLDADESVRAIVVTGTGRTFSTGLDMNQLGRDPAALREFSRRTRVADLALTGWHLGVRTPTIAAVNGVCAGGGLHFVVDADVVLASSTATFLDPHVSVGQASAWEAVGLARRMPFTVAARLALIGRHERLDVRRAYQIGLVSAVIDPPEELQAAAQRLGERIARADVGSAAARRAALWKVLEVPSCR